MNAKTEFIKNNLLIEKYFQEIQTQYVLKEKENTGKSELTIYLNNEDNLCIEDYDHSKKCSFFKSNKELGTNKSVDHVVFQNVSGKCVVHLIEMKTSVGAMTWGDIKRKVRTSYLNILALTAVLDIKVQQIIVHTTYIENKFDVPQTNPRTKATFLGAKQFDPKKDEWDKNLIHISIGEILEFQHNPVLMLKENDRLIGELNLSMVEE